MYSSTVRNPHPTVQLPKQITLASHPYCTMRIWLLLELEEREGLTNGSSVAQACSGPSIRLWENLYNTSVSRTFLIKYQPTFTYTSQVKVSEEKNKNKNKKTRGWFSKRLVGGYFYLHRSFSYPTLERRAHDRNKPEQRVFCLLTTKHLTETMLFTYWHAFFLSAFQFYWEKKHVSSLVDFKLSLLVFVFFCFSSHQSTIIKHSADRRRWPQPRQIK